MLIVLTVLITIACVLLTLIVLIQNPKGGGLSSTFGGFSNQMMGVKRTTDFLEKATWTLAIILIVFSLATKFWTPEIRGIDSSAPINNSAPANPSGN
jgi:preprotein translocase subunit SecG